MTTREQYIETETAAYKNGFMNHQIIEHGDDWWYMGPNGASGNLWVEVRCLRAKTLLVYGDFEPLLFAYGPKHPLARVRWLATEQRADSRYFMEKATIGTGHSDAILKFNGSIAVSDLLGIIEDNDEMEKDLSESFAEEVKSLGTVFDDWEMQSEVCELMQRYGLWEDTSWVGMVPTRRVFAAHATLTRLGHLLSPPAPDAP